jgi:T5orf172 domain
MQEWRVRTPRAVEQEVHRRLGGVRVNPGREFFRLKYAKARETIEAVIKDFDALIEWALGPQDHQVIQRMICQSRGALN